MTVRSDWLRERRHVLAPLAIVAIGGPVLGLLSAYAWESMYGFAIGSLVLAVGLAMVRQRALRGAEIPFFAVGLNMVARVCLSFAYMAVAIRTWGVSDFITYQELAVVVGEGLLAGELRQGPLLHEPVISVMYGSLYLIAGSSLIGLGLLAVLLGSLGGLCIYLAATGALGAAADRRTLIVFLFGLPSFGVFTSVLGKDSWMLFFLGLTTFGFSRALRRRAVWPWLVVLVGVAGVTVTRRAIGVIVLFALVSARLLIRRPVVTRASVLRPVVLTLAIPIAVIGFARLTDMAVADKTGEQIELVEEARLVVALEQYHRGLAVDANKIDMIGIKEQSATAILLYLPLGIFRMFFHPHLLDAQNVLALLAAVENAALMVLFVLRRRSLLASARRALDDPFLAYCWIACVALSVIISIAPNFGVLMRQRTMVLPFLAILMAVPATLPKTRAVEPRQPQPEMT